MKNSQIPNARTDGLVVQEMPDEVLVYDLDTNKAHCLNQTAAFVWKSCDGVNSVTDITDVYQKQFGQNVPEDMIWLALDQLGEKNLLENPVEADFQGQTRREVIKRVGLAAVVALPIVASLTAPTAAMAVACSGVRTSCTGCDDGTVCNPDGIGPNGTCTNQVCSVP